MDPQHGASQKCEPCGGRGQIPHKICEVHQCQRRAEVDRKICKVHAFPAARPKGTTGRRAAVLATKKKLAAEEAKVSEGITDGSE
jgi:DnaJ-class molecular chaperone